MRQLMKDLWNQTNHMWIMVHFETWSVQQKNRPNFNVSISLINVKIYIIFTKITSQNVNVFCWYNLQMNNVHKYNDIISTMFNQCKMFRFRTWTFWKIDMWLSLVFVDFKIIKVSNCFYFLFRKNQYGDENCAWVKQISS